MKKTMTTRRKTKIIGKQTYLNRDTGELVEMDVLEVEERDANFHKLWLGHIVHVLDIIGNKKIKVVNYVMENINKENLFIGAQAEISRTLNVSATTVNETFKALLEGDFLVMVQQGVYQVNPNVIFKGGKSDRLNVLIKYKEFKPKPNVLEPEKKEGGVVRDVVSGIETETRDEAATEI